VTISVASDRIKTGVRNLDEILCGGVPTGSLIVLAGTPGAGKTILSQQIIFHNASPQKKALIFHTLSEPTAKTLRYLKQFEFFNSQQMENESVEFVDLGGIMRNDGLKQAASLLLDHVKRTAPAFVVVDSFKVFEDLARSQEELRKFSYEIAIQLMAWECTTLLLGEFNQRDIETNPLFSIADGLLRLTVRQESGEQQRFVQAVKLRGTDHSRDDHPFSISSCGVEIYAPKVTIRRDPDADRYYEGDGPVRAQTGISGLDALLGEGIPYGSSVLVSGVAGTGKTTLSLEFIYRGAKEFGEKGIFVSFEETEGRLRSEARSMGWDLDGEIKKGNVELICIPQTDILIERQLLMIHERIERLGAKRIAIDSISLFLYKVGDERIAREKIFQLATIVQKAQAVGLFAVDIPYGQSTISRFGVEETTVDGVFLLSAIEEELSRDRYFEVYKLRNTAHLTGKHPMTIGPGGIHIGKSGKVKK
jgi:circadian clock protein KaiC